jgi:hypothetical protein
VPRSRGNSLVGCQEDDDLPVTSPAASETGGEDHDWSETDGGDAEESNESGSESANARSLSTTGSHTSLIGLVLDAHRRQAVDCLMEEFEGLLGQNLAFRSRPASTQTSDASPSAPSVNNERRAGLGGDGKEQGQSNNSAGSNEAGGAGSSRGSTGAAAAANSPPNRKLGCPFFKRDPRRHSKHRSCTGPGWKTVHRVKYVYAL